MIFEHVEVYPGDPILSLMDDFNKDVRRNKVNLSIGFYYDHKGNIPVLDSVIAAKAILDQQPVEPNLYLPMSGDPNYCKAVQKHIFGDQSSAVNDRIVTIQSVGGSGALRVGADFLKSYYPDSKVYVSNPTWDNHLAIFSGAGFDVLRYPYLNEEQNGVDFPAMLATFESLPAYSIVLLHACCHNPTGIDLEPSQWDKLFALFKEKKIIPFLDSAYLGLGDGLEKDAYAIRALAQSGLTGFISNSFSKVFSLYGERVGSLSIICESAEIANKVLGQVKATVRSNYSNPPRFGAQLVRIILENQNLYQQWLNEVETMLERMLQVRSDLHKAIKEIAPELDVSYLLNQKGMFSFTGLSAQQVDEIREKFGVYLIRSGRICIAGLNDQNIQIVAEAIAEVSSQKQGIAV